MLQLRRHASWTWSPSLEVLCYLRHRESQGHGNQSRVLSSSRLRVLKQKPRKNKAPKKKKNPKKSRLKTKDLLQQFSLPRKKKDPEVRLRELCSSPLKCREEGKGRRQERRLGFGGGEKRDDDDEDCL